MLSKQELKMMREIEHKLSQVRAHLLTKEFPESDAIADWYIYLSLLKSIQGNFNNDVGFVATLMAKQYLVEHYRLEIFDAADKAQGAPGIDMDVQLPDGRRVIAEIKATNPYKPNDLGAQQKAMFEKDFEKLARTNADIKFFFLTETITFELMKKAKYTSRLTGVIVVLLPSGPQFLA